VKDHADILPIAPQGDNGGFFAIIRLPSEEDETEPLQSS
jgi:hypothetical protein